MPLPFQKLTLKTQQGKLPLLVLLPLTLTILVGLVGWYGLTSIERTLREQTGHEIQNTLKAAQAGLHLWAKNMGHEVESWVAVPEVRTAIMALAHKTTAENMTIDSLKASKEFTTLRALIGPFTQRKQHVGFVPFDQSGLQIVALLEDTVGQRDLTVRSDFVKRALAPQDPRWVWLNEVLWRNPRVCPPTFVASAMI